MTDWPSDEQISKIARSVASRHLTSRLSYKDKLDAARDGIIDAVAEGDCADMHAAARAGINAAVVKLSQHYGLARSGGHTGSHFATYWSRRQDESFADDLVDTMAVNQIMGALPPSYAEALRVHGETQSVSGTASVLGINYKLANWRVNAARAAARELWYSPDSDPGHWKRALSKAT